MRKIYVLTVFLLSVVFLIASNTAAEVGVWEMVDPLPDISVAVTQGPTPESPSIIIAGFYNYSQPGLTRKSIDGGITWSTVLDTTAWSLAVDPFQPNVIYAVTENGLFMSTNNGDTWGTQPLNEYIRDWVIVSPANSQIIYADNFKTIDGGQNWYNVYVPFGWYSGWPSDRDLPQIKISPADPATVYMVNSNQLYISLDWGESYTEWGPGGVNDCIEANPVTPSKAYLGNCGGGSSYYIDGGWYPLPDEITGHLHAFVVDPTSPNIVYSVSESAGVNRSLDSGFTWAPYMNGFSPYFTYTIPEGRMVFDASDGTIYLPTLEGLWRVATWGGCTDADGDGYFAEEGCGSVIDCNDNDPLVNPGALEDCIDGVDNDCDDLIDGADPDCPALCFFNEDCPGPTDYCQKDSGDCDGQGICQPMPGSCPAVWVPICGCDGTTYSNDCTAAQSGMNIDYIGECGITPCTDNDGDGYAIEGGACGPVDCDDVNPAINPGANEVCDGIDNDCDGQIDEGYDQDNDGFTSCGGDCNDSDPTVYPGANEVKHDGIDQDCNGYDLTIDITLADYWANKDQLTVEATSSLAGTAALELQWTPDNLPLSYNSKKNYWSIEVKPAGGDPGTVTVCGIEGCESASTGGEPPICTDGDGDQYFAEPDCGTEVDCDDADPLVNPGAVEICDNLIDDNCNKLVDGEDPACGGCVPTSNKETGFCADGIDNDCDGGIDCQDRDCRRDLVCQ